MASESTVRPEEPSHTPASPPTMDDRIFGTFVVDNKSAILWRSPLCGVQPDEAAWSGLRGLERHITGEGQRLCKNAMSPLSLDQDLMGFDAGGSQRAMAFAFVSRSILA